jgi:hypothetical protein
MNQGKQIAKIAAAVGWKKVYNGPEPDNRWLRPDGLHYATTEDIPDYLTDLNAIHEAVETLRHKDGPEWYDFGVQLGILAGGVMNCIQASAAMRAEAFLKTLGLWEEG